MTAWTRDARIGRTTLVAAFLLIGSAGSVRAVEHTDLTPEQKGWALATSAVLWERNADRHDLLAGRELTEANRRDRQQLLERSWGVRNRDDLLSSLSWIHSGGSRRPFRELGEKVLAMSPARRRELEPARQERPVFDQQVLVVDVYYRRLGAKGLLGWDYARYVALCRWGYQSAYLTEDEAWGHIIPAARLLQATFSSWKELGENYLIGREFWSPEEHRQSGALLRKALHRLLTNPDSPWKRYPWDLNLVANEAVESRPAGRAEPERSDAIPPRARPVP